MKMQTLSLLTAATACVALNAGSANAALVVDLGNNPAETQLSQTIAVNSVNEADVQESSSFTSGTLTTTGVGPVTFDLEITATNGQVRGQNLGFGVTGGTADSGIDNNNTAGPLESMTFTISDFTGLGAGESLVITGLSVLYGNTNESYTINGGASTNFATSSDGGNPAEFIAVNGSTVTIGAGTTGDTRFVIDSITVEVVPEPGSLALLGLGALLVSARRRRG